MSESGTVRLDDPLVRLVGVLALGAMVAIFDATIVNVGIHTLTIRLHTTLSAIQWVSTAYLLGVSVATPVSGWAFDRVGGRTVWLTVVTLFVIASGLSASAWSVGSLIAFRALQGLVGGMLVPTMLTLLARAAGPARAGRVFGMASLPIAMGPILGPIVGGLIIEHLSWRWMFLINVPIGVAALLFAVRFVPGNQPSAEQPRQLDVIGMFLLSPGFAAITYALSQVGAGAGLGAVRVVTPFAVGGLLLACYIVHALSTRRTPLIDLRLFARRGFTASITVVSFSGAILFATLFLLPLYYQQLHGFGVLRAGLLLVPLGVGGAIGMPIAGKLSDKLGPRALVPIGAIIAVAMVFAYTKAGSQTSELLLAGGLVLYGFGLGFVDAPTMSSAYRTVPKEATTSATGALYVLNQVFASLGVAVVALQLQASARSESLASAFHNSFLWLLGAAAVILIASIALPGKPVSQEIHSPDAEHAQQGSQV